MYIQHIYNPEMIINPSKIVHFLNDQDKKDLDTIIFTHSHIQICQI